MQNLTYIPPEQKLVNSRSKIVNNDISIASNNSGSSIPTYERDMLEVGITYYNTSERRMYILTQKGETAVGDIWEVLNDVTMGAYTVDFATNSGNANTVANRIPGTTSGDLLILGQGGLVPPELLGNVNAFYLRSNPPGTGPNNILQLTNNGQVPASCLESANVAQVGGRIPGNLPGNLVVLNNNANIPIDQQGGHGELRMVVAGTREDVLAQWGTTWHICDGTNGTPNLLGERAFVTVPNTPNISAGVMSGTRSWTMTLDQLVPHFHSVWGYYADSGYKWAFRQRFWSQGSPNGQEQLNTNSEGSGQPIPYDFSRVTVWPIMKIIPQ